MLLDSRKKAALPFRAYSGDDSYVFVSYAHLDSHIVYPIIKDLYDSGILLWYDEGIDAGEEWPQKIAERILNCSRFMLFVSPASVKSNHVRQEITFANSKHKPILPIHLEPTRLSPGLEMTLSVFQSVFYFAYKDNPSEFYKQIKNVLMEDTTGAGCADTQFVSYGSVMLRLDLHGDKALPHIIHLPESGKFSIGRFDVSVGFQQSDFEFGKDTMNISRRHAVFERTLQGYTVTDLGSKAGTWVNGSMIPPHMPTILKSGNHISFGRAGASYVFESGT